VFAGDAVVVDRWQDLTSEHQGVLRVASDKENRLRTH
jgi:hypothetical protein